MKEPSSTFKVFLVVAFSLFNYKIAGRTSHETEQANLADKLFQTVPKASQRTRATPQKTSSISKF